VRDCVYHLFGSGFPKNLSISKAIDAHARRDGGGGATGAISDAAKAWDGWGTCLKPAVECWWLCMKPLDGTFAQNAIKFGVAGLNVDGGRIDLGGRPKTGGGCAGTSRLHGGGISERTAEDSSVGRFPANLILDEEVARGMGEVSRYFYCPKVSPSE